MASRPVIVRPRLLELLRARTVPLALVVAPAGYGKTTLLRQWMAQNPATTAYSLRPEDRDPAVLSVRLADKLSDCTPSGNRTRPHHATGTDAKVDAEIVARLFADGVAVSGELAVAFDDYHHLAGAVESEAMVEAIVRVPGVRTILASRQRPSWISPSEVLYGEVCYLGRKTLAMTVDEAADLLSVDTAIASCLIDVTEGWPALTSLAALEGIEAARRADVPELLYEFVAEEVIEQSSPCLRQLLQSMTLLPPMPAEQLLGLTSASPIHLEEGRALGLVNVELDGSLFPHPLLGAAIASRSGGLNAPLAEKLLRGLIARRSWDAAFNLIETAGLASRAGEVIEEALPELLDQGRGATLQRWVEWARTRVDHPAIQLADAELALRRGQRLRAKTLATGVLQVAPPTGALRFRSWCVIGASSHLLSEEAGALAAYERALEFARTENERRRAVRGALTAAIDMELPLAEKLLEELRTQTNDDPVRVLDLANLLLSFEMRMGALRSLTFARDAFHLIDDARDPWVTTAFLSVYQGALVLDASYVEALQVGSVMRRIAAETGIAFAPAYSFLNDALAHAGRRDWQVANDALESVETSAPSEDTQLVACVHLVRSRIRAEQGYFAPPPNWLLEQFESLIASTRAEAFATHALVHACRGESEVALTLARDAELLSRSIEVRVLVACVRAISSIAAGRVDDDELCTLVSTVRDSGNYDNFICAYRAHPPLLTYLLVSSARADVMSILERGGDSSLLGPIDERPSPLTTREREIIGLVAAGLDNRAIASALFISPATVKTHIHNIFEKLGARSRVEAIILSRTRERSF